MARMVHSPGSISGNTSENNLNRYVCVNDIQFTREGGKLLIPIFKEAWWGGAGGRHVFKGEPHINGNPIAGGGGEHSLEYMYNVYPYNNNIVMFYATCIVHVHLYSPFWSWLKSWKLQR